MSRALGRLTGLKRLTDAAWLSAGHRLRQAAEREREIAARIATLSAEIDKALAALAQDGPANREQILAAGRWAGWAEAQKKALNAERARLRVALELEREAARAAFGRDRALGELIARAKAEQARRRRA